MRRDAIMPMIDRILTGVGPMVISRDGLGLPQSRKGPFRHAAMILRERVSV